ncbi:ElyC/SanA/YdcF family protein [Celerinatantimonas yamalensis]|uniref:ElyC/SanA/YdcF family protein n=1 Tax=Celerinatantimonas yamalensis TaxID=559956 RepID=A0ABW9G330_9GAMM
MQLGWAFVAKKWLAGVLMPLNVSILLLFFTFYLCLKKRPLWACFPLGSALAIILLTSNYSWVNHQLYQLERRYTPPSLVSNRFDFIVVLGGGHVSDPSLSPIEQLSRSSLLRILRGIQLAKENPGARLIVSGYSGSDPKTNAELMKLVATQADILPASIITVPKAKDTAEEARLISIYIGQRPTALVTSAVHMERAMKYFQQFSNQVTAVPTDYLAKKLQSPLASYQYLPDPITMMRFDAYWHEKLGEEWAQIQKKLH